MSAVRKDEFGHRNTMDALTLLAAQAVAQVPLVGRQLKGALLRAERRKLQVPRIRRLTWVLRARKMTTVRVGSQHSVCLAQVPRPIPGCALSQIATRLLAVPSWIAAIAQHRRF
jgi:hypothetical protein